MKFGILNLFHRHNQKEYEIKKELNRLHKEKQKIKEKERKLLEKLKNTPNSS